MNPQTERRQSLIYRLSLISAVAMLALAFVVSLAEMYVRWKVNKDFTFLGGGELAALTISGAALLLGLMYSNHSR